MVSPHPYDDTTCYENNHIRYYDLVGPSMEDLLAQMRADIESERGAIEVKRTWKYREHERREETRRKCR